MKEYIEVDSLWKCETCFHHRSGKCSPNVWCENGENYRPDYGKLTIIKGEIATTNTEELGTIKKYHMDINELLEQAKSQIRLYTTIDYTERSEVFKVMDALVEQLEKIAKD